MRPSPPPGPDRPGQPPRAAPLDSSDPRFVGVRPDGQAPRPRRLVASQGPGASAGDPLVRILRVAVPALSGVGVLLVAAVFFAGLSTGERVEPVGDEADVRAAVAERPRRVCLGGEHPCAWLTVVDGELLALSTAGPLREERGRQGVGWCPSSGWYGSNNSGSRFDARGEVVRGPAPRGLDRYRLTRVDGELAVDFSSLRTGLQAARTGDPLPARGPDCEQIPLDPGPELPR